MGQDTNHKIEISKLKTAIEKLIRKYGVDNINYPSKVEVLRELEKLLWEDTN